MQRFLKWHAFHWAEYAAELLGTAFNLFVGLSAVVLDFGSHSPVEPLIPDRGLRLLLTGLVFAGSGSLVAISPLGKLSGAHINPSVTLAFWVQGKMHRQDLIGYISAQFVGAILGVTLLAVVWRDRAASIKNGMTLPGSAYSSWMAFGAEVSITFLLVLLIFIFVSSTRLMRWTPLMTWFVVAIMVWLESPVSGTSLNPARSFAPALVTPLWKDQWVYLIAPPLGSLLAVMAFRSWCPVGREILTGKLFHAPHYRSIFKNVKAPHRWSDRVNHKVSRSPSNRSP